MQKNGMRVIREWRQIFEEACKTDMPCALIFKLRMLTLYDKKCNVSIFSCGELENMIVF